MKKNLGTILAIALSLSALLLTIAFQAGWVKANPFKQEGRAGAPSMVSYQGQIWDGIAPYDGDGYFMFAIINEGGDIIWSNDGSRPPETSIPLPVTNGLFSVNLGDTSIPGMDARLSSAEFDEPIRLLRVWFSPDDKNWTQMPDQVIAAVPYAYQAQYAQNSDAIDGINSSAFQLRVTGSCSVGQAVRAINFNGTVVCETLAASPTFSLSTIDSTWNVGFYNSMAIGTDGLGLISYWDGTSGDLKVAHCIDTNCSSATSAILDSTGNVGWYTSIGIGTDGFGLISYYDYTNKDLKVAHCTDTNCSSATSFSLDSTGFVGEYTSITIGADGFGLISYYDATNGDLKVAHCTNTPCSSATSYTLDFTGDVGYFTSIAIGTDGFGLISYIDVPNGNFKVAHCSNTVCSSATVSTLDSAGDVGGFNSIAIGIDGLGLISYWDMTNGDLKVAHCDNTICTSAYISTLDSTGYTGYSTSITIGIDGYGVISFWSSDLGLRLAHCANVRCNDATIYTLDSTYSVAYNTSIVIGDDGYPLISYDDGTFYDLKVAHCSNELCIPINWEH